MKKCFLFLCLSLLIILASSCKFSKVLKGDDPEKKYTLALKLYDEKDYSRALQLFDQLMGAMRATDKAQKIYYLQSYCYYYSKDYTMAAYYFKRYTTNFPNTREAEECAYMSALCSCQNSPDYNLDQTITKDALKELQNFINTYPDSKRIPDCNDLIDKMRAKLELKDYKIGLMYYRMEDYQASITIFNNILKEYPETQRKEEILFYIFKAYNKYALASVITKKKERILKAFAAYNDLAVAFPQSKYLPEAQYLKKKTESELEFFGIKHKEKYKKLNKQ
jgi:outer membrane protein assembly factor BamD